MLRCHTHGPGCNCCEAVDRRGFLEKCGAAVLGACGSLGSLAARASEKNQAETRVAAVFLRSMDTREIWPYPGFDCKTRQRELLSRLQQSCPGVRFIPVAVENASDMHKAIALKDSVDGYLVYTMTLVWRHRSDIVSIAQLGKPMVVADEFLGGSGVFLTGYSQIFDRGIPAVAVSTRRFSDLVLVARQFASVRAATTTPASFAKHCEKVYRGTFGRAARSKCLRDTVELTDIQECVERFRRSRFLIIGRGHGGQEHDFLGAKGRYADFEELQSLYNEVDRDEAAAWAERWSKQAQQLPPGNYIEPSQPRPDAVRRAGALYLAMLKLLKKYETDSITINCLSGFTAGKLPAYPCLGFMQILNDGGQGVCEAMPDDTISMLMARILTGRPGFVSDPALDTSKNQIVYAHCVGTTKVFGPDGTSNGYRIRTLHNRDPRGAAVESLMPAGYMTTSFRTNFARKKMVIHQAKAIGPLETEKGCRTKLLAEVRGDIGKLFNKWSQFGWHRVTVYGDVKEPLVEFAKALGLSIVEEA